MTESITDIESEMIGTKDITEESGLDRTTVLAAFQSGELAGRNFGGSRGWVTTRRAFLAYLTGGNVDTKGVDDAVARAEAERAVEDLESGDRSMAEILSSWGQAFPTMRIADFAKAVERGSQ